MEEKLIIVHGYSDGSTSFKPLRDFFVKTAKFDRKNVYHLDYASMDDDATFRDFADKLDADYTRLFHGERINVACHSTGALVVRMWLVLRRLRQRELHIKVDCPVKRLLMFAPANFGSDLAKLGQSFLGKFQSTFFNNFAHSREDFMESGKIVLKGLEPASPLQWDLSEIDLHREDYFSPQENTELICFPFIFAAGKDYKGELQAKIIKKRQKPGTDGTVRICGTNLNTRKCTISFLREGRPARVLWHQEVKFPKMPFAVFKDFNHGSIIDAEKPAFRGRLGPKALILSALKVNSLAGYEAQTEKFAAVSKNNYGAATGGYKDQYQQFFFRVRDDVDRPVTDCYIDFYVIDRKGKVLQDLTEQFDRDFEANFYTHSEDKSCRALMIKCRKITAFVNLLKTRNAKLVFDVEAGPPLPNVTYKKGIFVVFDGSGETITDSSSPSFLYPNTTTLVDIVLNRVQGEKLMNVKDHDFRPVLARRKARAKVTGRGLLV